MAHRVKRRRARTPRAATPAAPAHPPVAGPSARPRPGVGRGSYRVFLLLILLLPTGCYHYRAAARQPASETAVGGSRGVTASGGEVVWSLLWGAVQETPSIDNCQGEDLAEVTVHSNLAFSLLTVATLGLVAPARVEWWCAKPSPAPGEIGAAGRVEESGVAGPAEESGVAGPAGVGESAGAAS